MMRDEGVERFYVFIAFATGIEYILANDVGAWSFRHYTISIAMSFTFDIGFSRLAVRQTQLAFFNCDGLGYVYNL